VPVEVRGPADFARARQAASDPASQRFSELERLIGKDTVAPVAAGLINLTMKY